MNFPMSERIGLDRRAIKRICETKALTAKSYAGSSGLHAAPAIVIANGSCKTRCGSWAGKRKGSRWQSAMDLRAGGAPSWSTLQ